MANQDKKTIMRDLIEQGKRKGRLTTKEISEALKAQFGMDIPKGKLQLSDPIKSFGTFQAKAKLYTDISGVVTVQVIEE